MASVPPNDVEFDSVLTQAAWNDGILQSYRGLFLTTQGLLIAVGVGLFAIAILATRFVQAFLASSLLTALVVMAVYFTIRVRALIVERRQRVVFSIKWLMEAEKKRPAPSRHITLFELLRQRNLSLSEYWRDDAVRDQIADLDDATLDDLLSGSDTPNAFFARNDIYWGMTFMWMLLLGSSWAYTFVYLI